MTTGGLKTRDQILHAALKRFAHHGYTGTSVQEIVDDAAVSKPALYYYFKDKASLYQALVDTAHDERYRLMQSSAVRASDLKSRLVKVLTVLFDFLQENRELMRLTLATAFAAPGEVPDGVNRMEKGERNFEFIHSLIKEGQAEGALDAAFDSRELAFGPYGMMHIQAMANLLKPKYRPNRRTAERIVKLFLEGAAAKKC